MAAKKIIQYANVGGNGTLLKEFHVIPNGEKWVIDNFGAADINNGDNKSSLYVLRYGTDVIKIISVTGATIEIPMKFEIIGNGVNKINVFIENTSSDSKRMPFWVEAHNI